MAGKIASLLIELGVRVDGALKVEANLKSLRDAAGRVGEAADSGSATAGRAFAALGRGLVSVGKFAWGVAKAIGGAAQSVYHFVKEQTEAIGATVRMSRALGLNVVEFQRLQHAAKFSGVSDESLASGMKRLNATLFDLEHSTGGVKGKGASAALKEIGLSLKDLQGKTRTEQLGIIADHLNKIHDGAQRSAIAAKLFGKTAGPEMMGLLAKGSEGINKLAGDAQVFTEEQAKQSAEFNRSIKEISHDIDVLVRDVALDLLPVVKDVVDAVKEWIGTNRKLVSAKTHEGIKLVSQSLRTVWEYAKDVGSVVAGLADRFGGLETILHGVVKVFEALALGLSTNLHLLRAVFDKTYTLRDAFSAAKIGWQDLVESKESGERRKKKGAEEEVKDVNDVFKRGQIAMNEAMAKAQEIRQEESERKKRRQKDKRGEYAEDKAKKEKPGLTGRELTDAILSGRIGALGERLSNVSFGHARAEDIKPTVAMTINNYNNDVKVTQNIKSTDPKMAGDESARQLSDVVFRQHAKAAQSLGNNVVR